MAQQRNWKRWTARVLLGLAVLALIAFLGFGAWASRRLARQESVAEALGGSLSYAEYLPALENGERNASHALSAASHLLSSMPPDEEPAAWRDVPLDRAVADAVLPERVRIWLERPENRLVLEILDLHASVREARLPHDQADELDLFSNRLSNERGIPMLWLRTVLRTRALARIADGRADDAYGDAALLLRLANWIQTEYPTALTWIIGNAVAKTGTTTMEELQQITPASPEARALLREELTLLVQRRRSWGLEGDRALSHRQMLHGGLWNENGHRASLGKALRRTLQSPYEKAFHAQWLAGYSELIRQANQRAYEREGIQAMLDDDSPFMIPVKFLVPNLVDSLDKTDAMAMRCQLALLALTWEEHREAEGSYPDDPGALTLPSDVFNGQPLIWRRESGHWPVYSVGVNQRDDGGVDKGTPQSGDEDDIVWRLPS